MRTDYELGSDSTPRRFAAALDGAQSKGCPFVLIDSASDGGWFGGTAVCFSDPCKQARERPTSRRGPPNIHIVAGLYTLLDDAVIARAAALLQPAAT